MNNLKHNQVIERKKPIKRTNKSRTTVGLKKNTITPLHIVRELMYIDENFVRNNNADQYYVADIRINDLYDPDPLILSGSVTGFAEQMNFYEAYRVLSAEVDLQVINNENFGVNWGVVLSNIPLAGVIGTKFQGLSYLENGFTTGAKLLASKGGQDRGSAKFTIEMSDIVGNKRQYLAEQGYTGFGLASPNLPLYMSLIVTSPTSTTLTNGVTTFLKIVFRSQFFQRKALST